MIIMVINILIIIETASVHYLFIKENSYFKFTLGLPNVTRSFAQTTHDLLFLFSIKQS